MKSRLDVASQVSGTVRTVEPTGDPLLLAAPERGRSTWPIGRPQVLLLLLSYLGLVGAGTAVGLLLKGPLDDTAVVRTDRRVSEWFVGHRTPNLNRYTVWGSDLADTFIKIGATAALALVLWLLWRRWLEPLTLIVSLTLEASAFITITWIVARPRPDVPRLEGSPVDSSFPSGHTAAAAAYGALAVIVFWHTRNRWARFSVLFLCAAITAIVAVSRMYRGMHYLSDVVAGLLLGAASVAISAAILSHASRRAATRKNDDVVDGTA